MINLQQEKITVNSQRTNSTLIFFLTHKQIPKKTKELFFSLTQ